MIRKGLPLPELAALVCDACRRGGVEVVLSGGACVSIYTRNKYESFDLDFVLASQADRAKARSVMEGLGFHRDGRHYRSGRTPYIVEFLSPPLSVGAEPVREVHEIRQGEAALRLLSPTDCVKDRLAAYYHWNDVPSLDQAVMVCADNAVDLKEVRRWSMKEGMVGKYRAFEAALAKAPGKGKRGT